jgi:hypothetical protein
VQKRASIARSRAAHYGRAKWRHKGNALRAPEQSRRIDLLPVHAAVADALAKAAFPPERYGANRIEATGGATRRWRHHRHPGRQRTQLAAFTAKHLLQQPGKRERMHDDLHGCLIDPQAKPDGGA